MRRKFLVVISLLLAAVFMLSGCEFVWYSETYLANPREETSEYCAVDEDDPREEEPLSGVLEVQIWTNESDIQNEMWKTIIDKFEEVTGVKVTSHIGSQVNTQMSGRWQDGNPPDVVALTGSGIPDAAWEESGVIADLSDIVNDGYVYGVNKKISDVVDIRNFSRSSDTAGYYRMATSASAYGQFYSNKLLSELGLTAPKNYTQLMEFVEQAKEKGYLVKDKNGEYTNGAFVTNGATGGYVVWSMVLNALASYGQEFADELMQGKASAWQDERVELIFDRLRTFCLTDGAMLKGTTSFDHTTAHIKFVNKNALLCVDGIWLPWEIKNNTPTDFDMQYVSSPLISEDQKPAAVAYTSGMMIASEAKNPENARAFVRFLYTMYAQQVFTRYENYIPMRTDLVIDEVPGLPTASKKILSYLTSDEIDLVYKSYVWGDLNEYINSAVQNLMTGKMTAAQAAASIYNNKFAKK